MNAFLSGIVAGLFLVLILVSVIVHPRLGGLRRGSRMHLRHPEKSPQGSPSLPRCAP